MKLGVSQVSKINLISFFFSSASESSVAQNAVDAHGENGFKRNKRDFWENWRDRIDLLNHVVIKDLLDSSLDSGIWFEKDETFLHLLHCPSRGLMIVDEISESVQIL